MSTDLSAAFDTMNHAILTKMEYYGTRAGIVQKLLERQDDI